MRENIPEIKGNRVLVCPLNWGLGHASRCIPIIKKLKKEGKFTIVGTEGQSLNLLKKELANDNIDEYIELKGIEVSYGKGGNMTWTVIKSLPKWICQTVKEHRQIKRIVKQKNIDTVISDNRFGGWCNNVQSIYITHQIMIKAPKTLKWTEPILHWLHGHIIKRYNECWIPDMQYNGGLSGDLSHKYPIPKNAKYIGPLSRFTDTKASFPNEKYDIVAIISGPEPQRGIFENEVSEKYRNKQSKVLIIKGTPGNDTENTTGNIKKVPHLLSPDMKSALLSPDKIICRSGYSTIMDLYALGLRAEICATPGQTEQEYLETYLSAKGIHHTWRK